MGSGGIGGTIAAKLCARGVAVTVITRNPEIAEVINDRGLRATYDQQQHTARPMASASTADLGETPEPTFTLCIIAVPPSSAEKALEDALPWLHLSSAARTVSSKSASRSRSRASASSAGS